MRVHDYSINWGEFFEYDVTSPSGLRWKIKPKSRKINIGDVAGCLTSRKRWVVGLRGKVYMAHNIVWLLHFILEDDLIIDHINGDSSDNNLTNLRKITQRQNCRNVGKSKNNKSGITGVSYHKRDAYWSASYMLDGKLVQERFYEKHYSDAFERAVKRRKEIEDDLLKGLGYTERHGK